VGSAVGAGGLENGGIEGVGFGVPLGSDAREVSFDPHIAGQLTTRRGAALRAALDESFLENRYPACRYSAAPTRRPTIGGERRITVAAIRVVRPSPPPTRFTDPKCV
jgi:hypothetical protein